jgi:geranylgeranyl pyrophosphate synthase
VSARLSHADAPLSAHALPGLATARPSPLLSLLALDLARTGGTGVPGEAIAPSVAPLLDRALGALLADVTSRQGKGVRARLVRHAFAIARASSSAANASSGPDERTSDAGELPVELPLALEALHAGSLVIDDVQDAAEERRGAPALHRVYGAPLAINAGNWLYFWPLSLIGRAGLPARAELAIRRAFEDAVLRCHAGQALDLSVRITALPRASVAELVTASTRMKTGALFALATTVGALAATAGSDAALAGRAEGGDEALVEALGRFGDEAGIALQMADDVSSLLRPSRRSKAEEDLRGARPTWPWAWIADALDDVSFRALQAAVATYAEGAGGSPDDLDALLDRMRPHVEHTGRVRVRRKLDAAFAGMRAALPQDRNQVRNKHVDALETEVRAAVEALLHGD